MSGKLDQTINHVLDAMSTADTIVHDSGVTRKGTGRYDAKLIRRANGRTYEAVMHADGYADQSYVRVSVWLNDRGWTQVVRLDGHEIAIASPHAKRAGETAEDVAPAQLRAVIDQAREIVEGRS